MRARMKSSPAGSHRGISRSRTATSPDVSHAPFTAMPWSVRCLPRKSPRLPIQSPPRPAGALHAASRPAVGDAGGERGDRPQAQGGQARAPPRLRGGGHPVHPALTRELAAAAGPGRLRPGRRLGRAARRGRGVLDAARAAHRPVRRRRRARQQAAAVRAAHRDRRGRRRARAELGQLRRAGVAGGRRADPRRDPARRGRRAEPRAAARTPSCGPGRGGARSAPSW